MTRVGVGAGRSHPPSLLRIVERTMRDDALVRRGDRILCACSGGPDSSALLHALARLRTKLGFALAAHGVDHGLRAEAAAELELVAGVARDLGVPFETTRVAVAHGANLMARARTARLVALRDAAVRLGASAIATGHTADDRAETFLLRLLRGAGPRGLAVLPSRAPLPLDTGGAAAPVLVRPLVRARRAEILAHLARHRVPFADDPTNHNSRFSRVRVRTELLPLLEEMSPGIVTHLCALADMLRLEVPLDDDAFRGLGRAQRQAIDRAARLGRKGVRLRVRGGEEIEVALPRAPVPERVGPKGPRAAVPDTPRGSASGMLLRTGAKVGELPVRHDGGPRPIQSPHTFGHRNEDPT